MMKRLTRFLYNQRGVAAVEMALVMPIMVILLLGSLETVNLLRADSKVQAIAFTTADLMTLEPTLSTATVNDIFTAASLMIQPFTSTGLKIGVASVVFDPDDGTPSVDWTEALNGGSVPDPVTLATGMGAPGESVVIVRVEYTYPALFAEAVFPPITLDEMVTVRPRRSDTVSRI